MPRLDRVRITLLGGAAIAATAIAVAGCGGSDSSSEPSTLDITATDSGQGKDYALKAPKTADGGLVEVKLTNEGKVNHSAQLIRLEGDHTVQDALAVIGGNSGKIPDWLRAEGGVEEVPAGESSTATVNLESGSYAVVDDADNGAKGPPATASFQVSGGSSGDLPSTDTIVTAASTGKDKWDWQVDGDLASGDNEITFKAEGKDALHDLIAAPVKGNASVDEIKKELESQSGGPPQTIDIDNTATAAVLDGGKSAVVHLNLKQPGKYALICFLTDRDGGKPHFEEGLLKEVEVQG